MSTTDRTPYVTVTVPGTSRVDELIPRAALHRRALRVARFLSATFGGATMREASGCYRAHDGRLIEEPVVEVTAYALTGTMSEESESDLREVAALWAHEWGQECILLNLSGRVELVEGDPEADAGLLIELAA